MMDPVLVALYFYLVNVVFFSSEDGTAYSFGENKLGQLGQGNQTDAVLSPAPVSQFSNTS